VFRDAIAVVAGAAAERRVSESRLWRFGVPLAGVALFALFALLYLEWPAAYFWILLAWGIDPFRFPFLDAHAVLSALQCARQGLDTYNYNPCDVLTRAFVYSPLILDAKIFPVTVAWNNWTGIVLYASFFLCLASLPAPRGRREGIVMALATVSTMCVFALERGNIDLVIFLLMVLAGHALLGSARLRVLAYAIAVFGAVLKFYPVVALVTALRERPRRFLAVAGASAVVLILFVVHYRHGIEEAMQRVPTGSYYTDFFWAGDLPLGLALLFKPLATSLPWTAPVLRFLPWPLLALLLFSCARRAIALTRQAATVSLLPEAPRIFLTLGAALIVGCFFAGQSIGYRGIFFLLLLPGLLVLARGDKGKPFRATAGWIVFLMWGEMFREALQHTSFDSPTKTAMWQTVKAAFWLFRELVWWRVIGELAGLLLCFVLQTDTAKWALGDIVAARRAAR
jgi:hypothetical protein